MNDKSPDGFQRRFVSITDEGRLETHFPPAAELKETDILGMKVLENGESIITIILSHTQSGVTFWNVMYAPCDSNVHVIGGRRYIRRGESYKLLMDDINDQMTELFRKWLPPFLPAYSTEAADGSVT
jgi:hypothetical protein